MSEPYRGREKRFWDERIRRQDRYTSIGRRSLPRALNRARKEALFGVIESILRERSLDLGSAHVLDAGCGTGIYSEFYASRGARVAGVDLSFEGLRATKAHGVSGGFSVASLTDLPFPDGRFDLGHVFSVLYHVVDDRQWRASLGELARVVRPGGLLVMRIEWVERTTRIADHVKHRARDAYLRVLTDEEGLALDGVHPFRDVVPLAPVFALARRTLPTPLSEKLASLVERFDLLRENRRQKVVVFRKG